MELVCWAFPTVSSENNLVLMNMKVEMYTVE